MEEGESVNTNPIEFHLLFDQREKEEFINKLLSEPSGCRGEDAEQRSETESSGQEVASSENLQIRAEDFAEDEAGGGNSLPPTGQSTGRDPDEKKKNPIQSDDPLESSDNL